MRMKNNHITICPAAPTHTISWDNEFSARRQIHADASFGVLHNNWDNTLRGASLDQQWTGF
jgi:hypothetical protein